MRQGLTILFVSLVPGIVVTLYFFSRSQVEAAHALALSAQRAAAENQLRLLQSQLEPHMLFNTLANLRVLIGMDPARAQQMLDQLIAFLRATLTASRLENHPLRDEFERLKDYLALMQIRMGSRLRPQLDLPAELADLPVAPLLLQPLVETPSSMGWSPPSMAANCESVQARSAACCNSMCWTAALACNKPPTRPTRKRGRNSVFTKCASAWPPNMVPKPA